MIARPSEVQRRAHPAAHRHRGYLQGHHRPGRDGRRYLLRRNGQGHARRADSRGYDGAGRGVPRRSCSTPSPMFDDEHHGEVSGGRGDSPRIEIQAAIRKATIANEMVPGHLRYFLQATRACRSCWTPSWTICPLPLDIPAIKGVNPETDEEDERHPSDDEPFSALAFKIATDPYVGRLCFFRVYSGTLTTGSSVLNSTKEQQGAHRPYPADARQPP